MTDNLNGNVDTTVKVSKSAMKILSKYSFPFESKKACIERIILQFAKEHRK